jgi:hypothetical protein
MTSTEEFTRARNRCKHPVLVAVTEAFGEANAKTPLPFQLRYWLTWRSGPPWRGGDHLLCPLTVPSALRRGTTGSILGAGQKHIRCHPSPWKLNIPVRYSLTGQQKAGVCATPRRGRDGHDGDPAHAPTLTSSGISAHRGASVARGGRRFSDVGRFPAADGQCVNTAVDDDQPDARKLLIGESHEY